MQQDTKRPQLDQSFHSARDTIESVETVRAMETKLQPHSTFSDWLWKTKL
jgi:hypothetical protein